MSPIDLKDKRGWVNRRLAEVLGIKFTGPVSEVGKEEWWRDDVYPHIVQAENGICWYFHSKDDLHGFNWDLNNPQVLELMLRSPNWKLDHETASYWSLTRGSSSRWVVFEMKLIYPVFIFLISSGATPNEAAARALIPEFREKGTL